MCCPEGEGEGVGLEGKGEVGEAGDVVCHRGRKGVTAVDNPTTVTHCQ